MNGSDEQTPLDTVKNIIRQRLAKPRSMDPSAIPGFADGTLQDQISQTPPQNATPVPQPTQQTPPDAQLGDTSATRPRTVTITRPPAQSRPRYAGVSDVDAQGQPLTGLARQEAEVEALRTAPRGAQIQRTGDRIGYSATPPKRTWKSILREGAQSAVAAGQADPGNPYAMLAGAGIGLGSGIVQPNVINREFEKRKAEGQLARGLEEQKAKAQIAASQSLPLYRQQQIGLGQGRLDQTRRRNDAYIGHLDELPQEKQAEAARKMYMAGIADGNPELKAEMARRMGLKEELPDTDKGSIEVAGDGTYKVIHGRTGQVVTPTETTQTPEGTTTTAPVTSFKKTQEADKLQMFEKSQKLKAEIASLGRAAALQRAQIMAGVQISKLGDPDEYSAMAERLHDLATEDEATGTRTGKQSAAKLRAMANSLGVKASQARSARGYGKSAGVTAPAGQASKKMSKEDFAAKFKARVHRDPTQAEIDDYIGTAQQ